MALMQNSKIGDTVKKANRKNIGKKQLKPKSKLKTKSGPKVKYGSALKAKPKVKLKLKSKSASQPVKLNRAPRLKFKPRASLESSPAKEIKARKQSAIRFATTQAPKTRQTNKNEAPKKRVLLVNASNNHLVSGKVVFADTAFQKFRGLMFRNRKEVDYAMVFDFGRASKNSAAIHMLFVFFPIDVVYLLNGKVVDLYKGVTPFTPYIEPKERADTLIELPQGAIWTSGIKLGDEIATISH